MNTALELIATAIGAAIGVSIGATIGHLLWLRAEAGRMVRRADAIHAKARREQTEQTEKTP